MQQRLLPYSNYLLILFVLLTACSENIEPVPTASVADTPPSTEENADPLRIAKSQYAEVERLIREARLRVDSMEYSCENDPEGGKIHFFRDNGQLMLLRHEYYAGDHFGATESYYLKNERPVFIHLEESSWSFGGPQSSGSDGPHTQDDIEEFRFYLTEYAAGKSQESLKCLQKSYVIRSWIELPTNPDEVPNRAIECGERVDELLKKFNLLARGQAPEAGC